MGRRERFALILDNLRSIKDYARACLMELERIRVAVEEQSGTIIRRRTPGDGLTEADHFMIEQWRRDQKNPDDDTCLLCDEDCTEETCDGPRERDCT